MLILSSSFCRADDRSRSTVDSEPYLRIEPGGPTSYVAAVAFSPDGEKAYAAGWDKVVHVWSLDSETGRFRPDGRAAFRVPIGPGLQGALNAMALSADGQWLAVGGRAPMRGTAGFRDFGLVVSSEGAVSDQMRLDEGTIHVFHTGTRQGRTLRGHRGPVLSLAFAPSDADKPPRLVSAAREWDAEQRGFVRAVRLWNVADSAQLDSCWDLPGIDRVRPQLAAWHTGAQPLETAIAIAWGAERTRIWDVAGKRFFHARPGRRILAVHFGARDKLLSGGGRRLRIQHVSRDGAPSTQGTDLALRKGASVAALSRIGSVAADGRDLAAVVVFEAGNDRRARLALLDVGAARFTVEGVELWSGGPMTQPSVASSADGRYLAVAGHPNRDVLLYRVDDLRAGRNEPQRLRGVGAQFSYAAFARKGDRSGLLLAKAPRSDADRSGRRAIPGDRILDLLERDFVDDTDGWQHDNPPDDGTRLELAPSTTDPTRTIVEIRRAGRASVRISLEPGRRVTAQAILPSAGAERPAILALATQRNRQPALSLYNAETGEHARNNVGHTEPIRSVEFSADGKLLVSTAEDRTVRVWSLAGFFERHLGQRGMLAGTALREEEGALVVVATDLDSAARRAGLRVGDVVSGVVEGESLRALATPTEFVNELALVKPGQAVTLRTRRNQQSLDLDVPASQSIDEQNPLFSLFVLDDSAGNAADWIGWSPMGPYETSHPKVERFLGWHFNTGDPDRPTAFALADQYRKEYYRKGILHELIKRGEFRTARDTRPLERPNLVVSLLEPGVGPTIVAGSDPVVVRGGQVTLVLSEYGDFAEHVAAVSYSIEGAEARALDPSGEARWSADLSGQLPRRGDRDVRLTVRTNESRPQEFTERLIVRVQPPAPKIATDAAERSTVQKSALPFRFEALPGVEGENVAVSLVHRGAGKEASRKEWTDAASVSATEMLELEPGVNVIEIIARNAEALAANPELESSRSRHVVVYQPPSVPEPAPKLSLRATVDPGDADAWIRRTEGGSTLRTNASTLRIEASIEATENLTHLELHRLGEDAKNLLHDFEPGVAKMFARAQPVALKPGKQTYWLDAKTEKGIPTRSELTIEYRPSLPRVELITPRQGETVRGLDPTSTVEIRALWTPAPHALSWRAEVLLDGRPLEGEPVRDPVEHALTASVATPPGEHRIHLRLSNEWGESQSTDPVTISYRRPPRIVETSRQPQADKPFVDVRVSVETPTDLPITDLEIAGRPAPIDGAEKVPAGDGRVRWLLRIDGVPIERGANRIRVRAANRDGWCVEPAIVAIAYAPTPPKKAHTAILEPARDGVLTDRRVGVRFLVRSETPPRSIELRNGSEVVHRVSEPDRTRRGPGGAFELEATPTVDLSRGINELSLRVVNDGGERIERRLLTCQQAPVRIEIDGITPADDRAATIEPTQGSGGGIDFAEAAPSAEVVVRGRVVWFDDADRRIENLQWIHARVNGFFQRPVRLEDRVGAERQRLFEAPVLLNRAEGNEIAFDLPGLEEDSTLAKCSIDCATPATDQELHLLVVGPDEKDKTELKKRALRALRIEETESGRMVTPGFKRTRIHGPLVDFVSPQRVIHQIERIRAMLSVPGAARRGNPVVMVFFQGEEKLGADGSVFLLTSDSRYDPVLKRSAIANNQLARFFARIPGAHLLCLDVSRPDPSAPARKYEIWPTEPHIGVLRYAWRQDSDVPENGRLVAALGGGFSNRSTLQAVESEVANAFLQLSGAYPRMISYDKYVHDDLKDLAIGAP